MSASAERLRFNIIKQALVAASSSSASPDRPRLQVLRPGFLPLSLHVLIDLPLPAGDRPELAVQLAGWAEEANGAAGFHAAAALPPLPAHGVACHRRVLGLLSCPAAPLGRYRIGLMASGQELASANVARRVERVRVLGSPPTPTSGRPCAVLISGTPKSGTTWLESIVNAHPDFLVLHEANTLRLLDPDRLSSDLSDQRDQRATRRIPWMPEDYDPADLARFLQVNLAKAVLDGMGRVWGARYVVDRTPGYADIYPFLEDLWEEVRVLHIVRHPLDVMTSWLFHEAKAGRDPSRKLRLPRPVIDGLNARLDAGAEMGPGGFVPDAAVRDGAFHSLARTWRRHQFAFAQAAANARHQFHLIRYEQLSANFCGVAGQAFAFLGTDPARADLAAMERATTFRALSGGREPGQAQARSFFRKGVVGDWRQVFSPPQAELIWAELADAAAAFGYAMD